MSAGKYYCFLLLGFGMLFLQSLQHVENTYFTFVAKALIIFALLGILLIDVTNKFFAFCEAISDADHPDITPKLTLLMNKHKKSSK